MRLAGRRDAYRRRLALTIRDWRDGANLAQAQWQRRNARSYDRLATLAAPPRLASLQARLAADARDAQRHLSSTGGGLAERVAAAAELQERLKATIAELERSAESAEERRYVEQVREIRTRMRSEAGRARTEALRAARKVANRISRMRAPAFFAARHAALAAAFSAYCDAWERFDEIAQREGPAVGAPAVQEVSRRRTEILEAIRALWPVQPVKDD